MEFLGLGKFSSCREPDTCGFQKVMGFRHSQNRNKSFYHPVRIPPKISINRLTGLLPLLHVLYGQHYGRNSRRALESQERGVRGLGSSGPRETSITFTGVLEFGDLTI